MPMQKSTFKSILLIGTHANLYLNELSNSSNITINSLKYKKKDPFSVDEPNQFIFNDIPIDFNGKYNLSNSVILLYIKLVVSIFNSIFLFNININYYYKLIYNIFSYFICYFCKSIIYFK